MAKYAEQHTHYSMYRYLTCPQLLMVTVAIDLMTIQIISNKHLICAQLSTVIKKAFHLSTGIGSKCYKYPQQNACM